ncbi:MAG TPA: alpha/beta hydrolase [Polyangia bacterium]|nr:alpha/beta hydrolase [Polyangia bacterium]
MLSAWARAERWVLRSLLRPLIARGDVASWRRRAIAQPAPFGVRVVPTRMGGVAAEWLLPADAGDTILYYLHGGGFVMGDPPLYRRMVGWLARQAGTRTLVPDYRLAPEHPHPAALDDCVAGYRALVSRGIAPEDIVIAGDSAGGALALATLVALRDAGDPLPAAAALMSPVTDLTVSGASMRTRADAEVLLAPRFCHLVARLYLGGADARAASPLFADLRGLPPLLVHVGTDELLFDDSARLAEAARAAGVDVTLAVWPELWHVFQMFVSMPEARRALDEIATFVRLHARAAAAESALADEADAEAVWAPERA